MKFPTVNVKSVLPLLVSFVFALSLRAQAPEPSLEPRSEIALTDNWRTAYDANDPEKFAAFTAADFDDSLWRVVSVPHNWDDYYGFRQVKSGHLFGHAWYRTTVSLPASAFSSDRRHFLFFEGVGAYATVWVNGKLVGRHDGGLTTFTFDVTDALHRDGSPNLIAVRADHPLGIRDLPWVNGGSERAYGFSEGSQPFGIHRPVRLVSTHALRVEPFGVHVFADRESLSEKSAVVHARTEIRNHGDAPANFQVVAKLRNADGRLIAKATTDASLAPGAARTIEQSFPRIHEPQLWSPADPHLYTLTTELVSNGSILDRVDTVTGFRTIEWRGADPASTDGRFFINGEPFLINGTAEYEHLLGHSHAFSDEQIRARVRQIQAAGFNAFRDAHHPHNLRYADYWQREGVLWWPQFGTHIWFDNEKFRTTFKARLRDWIKERRNNPAAVLWGLQNESRLPAAFAAECVAIIREMDPNATIERKITTCNGGEGSDWNVPQNWSGTYGGDPETYAEDLRTQRLVGEYGAWRSLEFHAEGPLDLKGAYTEERFTAIMETKVRLLEKARDYASGHFMWPFATHANPGRNIGELGEQTRDGWRELDQIGPANNKGLLTIWGEPLDAFYMYRSNFAPKETDPMVYIASHTWPDRWPTPGKKSGIIVYSNCDEVELFNDLGEKSLGVRTRGGIGTHFRWDDVEITTNTLYAEGRVGGQVVARDLITLHHLPVAPALARHEAAQPSLTAPAPGQNYLYRVNLGGPEYIDEHGQRWFADRDYREGDAWGTASWAQQFPNLPAAFGSQRRIFDPIAGARDDALFQTFRYGRDQLRFVFDVPYSDSEYTIELFFTEPWYGTGGGDATGWRLFDVAVNGETKIRDLDVWKESGGRAHALKKIVTTRAKNGRLEISFPRVASYQAVISAIAISHAEISAPAPEPPRLLQPSTPSATIELSTHLDTGERFAVDRDDTIVSLPESLRAADWIRFSADALPQENSFHLNADAELVLALPTDAPAPEGWSPLPEPLVTRGQTFALYRKFHAAGSHVVMSPKSGPRLLIAKRALPLPPAQTITAFEAGPGWKAAGHLKMGQFVHTDGDEAFVEIAPNLTDADWLQTPRAPSADQAPRFTVDDHVEIYVALPEGVSPPHDFWTPATDTLKTSSGQKLAMFRRRGSPGQTIDLQGIAPVSVLIRAVRAASFHEAEEAAFSGAAIVQTPAGHSGRGAVKLPAASEAKSELSWTIDVGVGSRYWLNFRYASDSRDPLQLEQTIITNEGRALRTDTITFPPVPEGRDWAILRTLTRSSINAGTYQIVLRPLDTTTAIVFDSLEVE